MLSWSFSSILVRLVVVWSMSAIVDDDDDDDDDDALGVTVGTVAAENEDFPVSDVIAIEDPLPTVADVDAAFLWAIVLPTVLLVLNCSLSLV